MPRTVSFPAPSTSTCPLCGRPLPTSRCPSCAVDLGSVDGATLWRVDHDLHDLCGIRNDLVARLIAAAPVAAPVPSPTPPPPVPDRVPGDVAVVRSGVAPVPGGPGVASPPPVRRAAGAPPPAPVPPPASAPDPSVAEVLVGLGALSLVAAVVVFVAVAWERLAAWAQGGLLVGATALVLGVAVACRRRGLVATSEALGTVAVVLAVADGRVAQVGLDGLASPRAVWAAGLAVVAAGAIGIGRWASLRSLTVAGAAVAFLPALVATATADAVSPLLAVLAAEALIAAVVASRLGKWPLERSVVALGAGLAWPAAALGALAVGVDGLASTPARGPAAPVVTLAFLAVGSVVAGRRTGSRGLAVAGLGLAFLPALLAAAAVEGSPTPLLWVLVAQALVAPLVAAALASGPGERSVLQAGGALGGAAAVTGALLLGGIGLTGDPGAGPAGAVALLVAMAGGWILVGRTVGPRELTVAGAVVAFVPGVLAAVGTGSLAAVTWAMVAQAGFAVVLGVALAGRDDDVRSVVHAGGATCAAGAAVGALALGVDGLEAGAGAGGAAAVFGALAVLAACGALLAGWSRPAAAGGLVAAVGALLAMAAEVVGAEMAEVVVATVAVTGGALALGAALLARRDPSRPWVAPMGAASGVVSALAVVPVTAALVTGRALVEVSLPPRAGHAGQGVADRLVVAGSVTALPALAVLAVLAALVLAAAAGRVRRQGWAAPLLGATVLAGALTLPVALDLSVGTAVGLLVAGVVAAAGWLLARPASPIVLTTGIGVAAVALGLALASAPLTVAVAVLAAAFALVLAGAAVRAGAPAAPTWVGGALTVSLGAAVLVAWALGASRSEPALVLAVAAAVAAGVAPAVERRGGPHVAQAAFAADVVVTAGLLVAALATRSIDALSAVVAVASAVAGASSLRPAQRSLWITSVAGVVVLTWLRLVLAGVDLVEAYTLPLAAGLLVIGLLARPAVDRSSWERFGPGLLAAVGPTTVLALVETGLLRTVAAVAAGVALVVWGAVDRRQAPLAIGAGAVGALAVRHLGPVAAELPRYVVFAVAGVVLVALGATFEQRRQDLRAARDSFTRLG